MSARIRLKATIVALQRTHGACPVVTFEFPAREGDDPLSVTLTLCEWKRIAQQIAEAAAAVGG